MYKIISALMLTLPLVAAPAYAQDAKPKTAQQGKMASCNKDAADKKGDDRKAFMKDCLSKDSAAAAPTNAKTANQKKFGDCSSSLKGQKLSKDDRQAKMKECIAK